MVPRLTEADPHPSLSVRVMSAPQVGEASAAVRRLAVALGFPADSCEELALVASELASNLVRHAHGGLLRAHGVALQGRTGIRIESEDEGPGIGNTDLALRDGYSTAGGLGTGLGTVNRLMDDFEFLDRPAGGTHIACQRWLRPSAAVATTRWLDCGVATRAHRLSIENGDSFLFRRWEGGALAGVIDGLGHGPLAHRAAQTARQYVEQHFDQPLHSVFLGADRACRATRGVVMALARFSTADKAVSIASIGNIEVRLLGGATRPSLLVRRGIVGLNAPQPAPSTQPWDTGSVLIMHSDGLSSHWQWEAHPELHTLPSAQIARKLLERHAGSDDDATVLVIRSAGS